MINGDAESRAEWFSYAGGTIITSVAGTKGAGTVEGEHEWWNLHPAKFPNEHQAGIHGTGSPANTLFKGDTK